MKESTVWWHWYKKCDGTYWHLKKEVQCDGTSTLCVEKEKVQCDGTGTKDGIKKYSVMALVHCVLKKKESTVWWHWYKKCDGTYLHLKKEVQCDGTSTLCVEKEESAVWWHWYKKCDGTCLHLKRYSVMTLVHCEKKRKYSVMALVHKSVITLICIWEVIECDGTGTMSAKNSVMALVQKLWWYLLM